MKLLTEHGVVEGTPEEMRDFLKKSSRKGRPKGSKNHKKGKKAPNWTEKEDKILKEHYPKKNWDALGKLKRTTSAIMKRAETLGVTRKRK